MHSAPGWQRCGACCQPLGLARGTLPAAPTLCQRLLCLDPELALKSYGDGDQQFIQLTAQGLALGAHLYKV